MSLRDDVSHILAQDMEYRLREIIHVIQFCNRFTHTQEATKFMRHSKRRQLHTEDVNNALKIRNIEVSIRNLRVDLTLALIWLQCTCVYRLENIGPWLAKAFLFRRDRN